ncbi:SusC/RagA family TonB-linked outer membrane protein [Seramator thermalis]|uniref:SusC/RagA family TonB-linked outer membrane protein n=1 Tax=Seramator thermalis TaxID=2496270 RepID=UPI00101D443B|nr:SusC/RagA family TonB-linked outer membrane protein [Seramator thermalis]
MKRKLTMFLALFIIGIGIVTAQTQVRGTVVDETGQPVIGATIQIKGTSQGTVTDVDGRFNLSAPANGTLVISYVGMRTQEVPVQPNVSVTLREDTEMLDEVVVTALGLTREKKTLGYGVASVSADEITRSKAVNPISALQGKVAGLDVSSSSANPGGTQNVVIRGYSSFGNNQPLYVVDGVPITNAQNRSGTDLNSQADFGSGINALNPNDIENITVLKGSAASALYGSRAAQGVIMITTKSGKNTDGKFLIAYDGGLTVQQVGRIPTEQTMFGQGWSGDRALDENGSWGAPFDGKERVWGNIVDNSQQIKPYVYLNNRIRDFYDFGIGYNNAVSLTGGNDKTQFHASVSQNYIDGPIPTNDDSYKRYTIASNGSHKANKLTVSSSINFSSERNEVSPTGQDNSIYRSLSEIATDISIVDLKDFNNKFNNVDNYFTPYGVNPYYMLHIREAVQNKYKFFGKVQLDYDILDNLKFTYRFGGDYESSIADTHSDAIKFSPGSPNEDSSNENPGWYDQTRRQRIQVNHDFILNYQDQFGDFSLNAIAGGNTNEQSYNAIGGQITSIDIPGFYDFTNSLSPSTATQASTLYRLWGMYLNADLGYRDYLYLTLTGRNDYSSTLPSGKNSYFYPSGMLSFLLTDYLKGKDVDTGILDFAKLRLSYGRTGKDAGLYAVNARLAAAEISNPGYPNVDYLTFPIGGVNAYSVSNTAGNINLKPELTDEFEIGADLNFFKHRLGLELSYYNKMTNGLIATLPIDPTTGYTSQMANLGDVRNQGIELLLNISPIRSKDFQWDISYNFTKNYNKVERLDVPEVFLGGFGGIGIYAVEGEPIGQFKSQKALKVEIDGVEHTVVDGNGNPQPTPNEVYLNKDINEKYRMGLTNTFTYKGLSLSGTFDFRYGGNIYSYTKDYMHWVGSGPETVYNDRNPFIIPNSVVDNLDGTYSENTTPVDPTALHTFYSNGGFDYSDFAVIDRSYLKLRNVSLVYELPKSLVTRLGITRLSASLTASNILLWTPAENQYIDPEITTFGNNIAAKFGEFGTTPPYQTYVFGLNVTF